ncbi:MAG: glutamate synthase-related protein [Actinomycetota bacterium]|nr:glutamate synthase-related protein [Actinomycetota bacterium]MDK1017569.1 glutamate synthase-related protein [Actinomycetota bacterium]MDK1027395.1 glutamate synthase-related protein [Actinomycetota bacterium]MDK1038510.1 glutamate synthase-related protein [Actinomycetota bacterium]MDK1097593.1 glutamate synthase-related protein [Actinomycetota bacterium]
MQKTTIVRWDDLEPGALGHALVAGVDLVVVRWPDGTGHSVLYGRCVHRGALMADGRIEGANLVCGVHSWDYRYDSGISSYRDTDVLHKFASGVEAGNIWVDEDEIAAWAEEHPQPYNRDAYQGAYQDPSGTPVEPFVKDIRELAAYGLERLGHHGATAAMGVPRTSLPQWDDIQIVTAQLARPPLLDDEPVDTGIVIGPAAKRPLALDIPLFVSDMSFGALSSEAKTALARGAELAGTAIASGEGGMLPQEKAESSRYLYELASARFGFTWEKIAGVQALHFKGGQAAKTGTGGHLPGPKVTPEIAEVRDVPVGEPAISPSRFPEWSEPSHFAEFASEVRERTGGIPIGFKLSAQHIEADLIAALEVGVDYVILDGRGGGTGAAPLLFRDNISVPTIPALARARRFLDEADAPSVTLIVTGGLRTPADFVKALALGADGVAVSNVAIQAIGCIGMRACHTNNCPVGIATQQPHLRDRLPVDEAAHRLGRYFGAATELMTVLARACGHRSLRDFTIDDLTTFDRDMAALAGIPYGGVEHR